MFRAVHRRIWNLPTAPLSEKTNLALTPPSLLIHLLCCFRKLLLHRVRFHQRLPRRPIPFRDSPRQLWVALVPNKSPALLIHAVIVWVRRAVLDEGLGIFQISVNGLDGSCHSIFLPVM